MIVSELIAKLQGCNQGAEVEYSDNDGEIPITDIEEEDGFLFLVSDEDDSENDED